MRRNSRKAGTALRKTASVQKAKSDASGIEACLSRFLIQRSIPPQAERVGFEPTVRRTYTRFPVVPIQPLSHLSINPK